MSSLYELTCVFVRLHDCEGMKKDVERYLESICLRIMAWALFWTCLVNETMFFKYWKLSMRRRAWKSKSNLRILAAWGLQEFKGPILMFFFYIFIYIYIYIFVLHTYVYIYICIICISASLHLCISASLHLCIYASMHLSNCLSICICMYLSIYL